MAACDWTLDTGCCADWESYPPEVQDRASVWAVSILDALTGRRFQQCPTTVRPCGPSCRGWSGYMTFPVGSPSAVGAWGAWMIPFVDGSGTWRNCACPGACSCEARHQILLPTPAAAVTEVMVDGVVLTPDVDYRVDSGRWLVRLDGEPWPQCQDMELANNAPGAFAVTYNPGEELPAAGSIAAGELACQFAKLCTGAEDCQLPGQMARLTRLGVQVEMVDPTTFLQDGLTGLPGVDLWVRSVNPGRLTQRARVFSPDVKRARFVG